MYNTCKRNTCTIFNKKKIGLDWDNTIYSFISRFKNINSLENGFTTQKFKYDAEKKNMKLTILGFEWQLTVWLLENIDSFYPTDQALTFLLAVITRRRCP